MEVGVVESPERVAGIAMDFPVTDDGLLLSSSPSVPDRLRRRLSESKVPSPSSVEEIEMKLRDASLRRQKYYENLSSKARGKPRSPSQSPTHGEDLGQRLEARLQAAEQKRLSIMEKAKMRLAKLDELRQAAKFGVEMRYKKERAELGSKVESRVQQAEANRMLIYKSYCLRRAKLKERTSESILRRVARESKYKQRVHAAICQKRAAAEKKRLVLLEADKKRAHARVSKVRKVAKSVSQQREIERRTLRDKMEDRLQRAKRQRAEYLRQRARLNNSVHVNCARRQMEADHLSRKLARCWKKFLKMRRTTLDLARAYDALKINESTIKSLPFEQLALLIESAATLQATKALLDRLESRYKVSRDISSGTNSSGLDDISHLLKRVASPNRKAPTRKSIGGRVVKKSGSGREAAKTPVQLSRYQVRVVLCAYMILGHPDAVFSGRGERESALAKSAEKFVEEFELLVKIILDGPVNSSDEESDPALTRRWTFRSQLSAFDAAWCSYLNSFVVWKVKDAESLEEDLVRAACNLELSMIQKCKITPEGDGAALTHDLKAIQKQVTEDQKLLRDKVMHLSGGAGIQRMENALADSRTKYFQARENGSPVGSPITHIVSPSMLSPSSSASPSPVDGGSVGRDLAVEKSERPSRVVRSLFKEDDTLSPKEVSLFVPSERLELENELIVNEFVHEPDHIFSDSFNAPQEGQNDIKMRLREAMEKAFWDAVMESMKQDEPKYDRVVELMREVRDELYDMAPQSWKQEITEAIDVDILSQVLNLGKLDMDYLGKILEFALVTLQKLSAAAKEDELKESRQNLMKELAELCLVGNGSSKVIALVKGLRFVLEQIQVLKQEISKARIGIMEPLLKGPGGLDYLGNAFGKRFGPPSDALTALPLTFQWISFVWANTDQEWEDHTTTLSGLNSSRPESLSRRLLPSTTIRSGGSFSVRTPPPNAITNAPGAGNLYPECKGEKVDLLVRLGLLKLVSGVSGLTEEALPETLKFNVSRLRAVQAQFQKIIVLATTILIMRQTLLSEKHVGNPENMERMVSRCVNDVSFLVDTKDDAGIEQIIEILSKLVEDCDKWTDPAKMQSRKRVMARMLSKSLQDRDAVFALVSRAIYLAVRGVVLGGTIGNGRLLSETALKKVGAAILIDRVIEAGKVLGVAATVSGRVHGPWYAKIVENM